MPCSHQELSRLQALYAVLLCAGFRGQNFSFLLARTFVLWHLWCIPKADRLRFSVHERAVDLTLV